MNRDEYEIMYLSEDQHWWYVSLRRSVLQALNRFAAGEVSAVLLDAGCGTGAILANIDSVQKVGLDLEAEALKFCRKRNLRHLAQASVCDLPYRDGAFDVIISLDVLCCVKLSDAESSLREFHRVLKPGGIVVLNLPAFESLKSSHDIAVHIQHRFRGKELRNVFQRTGFTPQMITYRNTFLFPLMVLYRLVMKIARLRSRTVRSDVRMPPGFINRMLIGLLSLENRMMFSGLSYPFGLSVFGVAKKDG